MSPLAVLALATVCTTIPVTLLVPGLAELVIGTHGGTRLHAHLFMAVNMLAGIAAIPFVMVRVRRRPRLAPWVGGALLLDAALFFLMGQARSVSQLLVLRAVEGAAHLPAITLLMVAAARRGERRGAALGLVAGAIMVGVAVGAPIGGALVAHGPYVVYRAGGALLVAAAALAVVAVWRLPEAAAPAPGSRYRWDRRAAHAWMPLLLGFLDRFAIGVYTSTFTLYLAEGLALDATQRGWLVALFMLPFAALCWPAGRLADRRGWLGPLVVGNVGFGLVYAGYGASPAALLPALMVVSGVCSALMYAPNLALVAEMARRGAGEGLFGAFQVAGSLGFLAGPLAGGAAVEVTRRLTGEVAYGAIFAAVGALAVTAGLAAWVVLRSLARGWAATAPAAGEALHQSGGPPYGGSGPSAALGDTAP